MHNPTQTPSTHLVFYSLLDAAAIVLGVILGGIAWGYSMACFLFG